MQKCHHIASLLLMLNTLSLESELYLYCVRLASTFVLIVLLLSFCR
uniref:Uncharacterized protein n=1 Tax=Arundo donax TaxID=35708 RepID=A0A0A8Y8H2_ARUDO